MLNSSKATRKVRSYRPVLEVLEDRRLLSLAAPTWVEQGPGPILNGQVEGMAAQSNPVAGGVEAIAAHPSNPDIAVIGTVNGGIWTTSNATDSSPTWIPRTDDLPTLSIGAIAYSPVDSNVLYAGTGSFSSGRDDPSFNVGRGVRGSGGPALGVLKSIDGGTTWAQVGGSTLNSFRIRTILPTTLNNGQVVLVGGQDGGGLFRSSDGGTTFTQISESAGLPAGLACLSIAADGADPNTFYAALGINSGTQGVFRSTDGGLNWTNISNGLSGLGGEALRIELAAHYDSGDGSKALYCAIIAQATGQLTGLFRSANGGTTWVAMDTPQTNEGGTNVGLMPRIAPIGLGAQEEPGGQGATHFSILADRTNEFVVFVGGDRQPGPPDGASVQFPNAIGAHTYSGRHFRGDASQSAGDQWYALDAVGLASNPDDGANGTSAHADSRRMVFDASGNILEGDDGGIYRLTSPQVASRAWTSVNGTLRATEFYSVAYDSLNNRIIGGTQDVGSAGQTTAGNFAWETIFNGDGGVAQVDVMSSPGNAIYYNSPQFLGLLLRSTWDSSGSLTSDVEVGLMVGEKNLREYDSTLQFIQPYVLNAVEPTRMLIGTTDLYESANQGDNLTDLNYGGGSDPIRALAYGGRLAGVNNPFVIYAGAGESLYLRTSAEGAISLLPEYVGSTVRDIVLDPDNWQRAYVLDFSGHVWRTTNAGASFLDVTNNLLSLLPGASTVLHSIEIFSRDSRADIGDALFVGGAGGVYGTTNPEAGSSATWVDFGTGLPNYLVRDIRYDRADDVLLVGGFGRGAWTLQQLSTLVDRPPPLVVVGISGGNARGSTVSIVDPATGQTTSTVVPFPNFMGEVRVASGDVNGDGKMETIAAAGPGGGPAINILDTAGKSIGSFFAYDPAFTGGLYISVSDVNKDGFADIITGAGAGGGPHVKIFNGKDLQELGSFFAYADDFRGGVSVASADINGDGTLDVVTGAGPGGGPHVKVFNGASLSLISEWFAYSTDFTGGVFVAVGDIGNDGQFEVVTGAGPGGGPVVAVFTPNGVLQTQFFAYTESFKGGVRVGVSDGNGDGKLDLVTGAGPGGAPHVKGFNYPQLDLLFSFFSGPVDDTGGVFVN